MAGWERLMWGGGEERGFMWPYIRRSNQPFVLVQQESAVCTGFTGISRLYWFYRNQPFVLVLRESAVCTGYTGISRLYWFYRNQPFVLVLQESAVCTGSTGITYVYWFLEGFGRTL